MDPTAQFAIDLIRQKIAATQQATPGGQRWLLDSEAIVTDLERIVFQIEEKDRNPGYEAPQLRSTWPTQQG